MRFSFGSFRIDEWLRVHREFMHQTGPTDVLTFQHGEIFISVETAKKHARAFGNSLASELCLYIAHGLLHLHGFDDRTQAAKRKMKAMRKKFFVTVAGIDDTAELIIPESARPIPTTAPYSLFELRAPYVSVSAMSRERRRGVGCRRGAQRYRRNDSVLDETGSVTTAEPTKETRSEEDLDLGRSWSTMIP